MFIMQGLPGSGKSQYAKFAAWGSPDKDALIVSADDFPGLYLPDTTGKLTVIVPHLVGKAHSHCFRLAVKGVQAGRGRVIVDNTNTTVAEVAPYVMLAAAYDYSVTVVRVSCDPAQSLARNTHGVPAKAINTLSEHLRQYVAPSHWRDNPRYSVREVPAWEGAPFDTIKGLP